MVKGTYIISLFLFFCCPGQSLFAQKEYELDSGWKCIRASSLKKSGEQISNATFSLTGWIPAVVPGTVLTTLLANKLIPDPFYGMNNKKIPDIYDVGRDYYTYWFVKDFKRKYDKTEKTWLEFRGVNYSYDAFLNGHKLNSSTEKGMYLRHEYEVGAYLSESGRNRLAVIVYPPDSVGNPNGGQGGDGTIAHGITNQYTAGWDWIQPVHDRNTGIWDKVFIKTTGPISIEHTHVVTSVPGVRRPGADQAPAFINVTTEVNNTGGNDSVFCELRCEIAGEMTSVSIKVAPKAKLTVAFPDITLQQPELWWPNGYGPEHLYPLKVTGTVNEQISDEEKLNVGVRQLVAVWNKRTQSRGLHVNGQKIFLKGGNRIVSDEMLRFSKERYDAEVRYHHDMNLNLIRVWGGGITERPEFYDACDKYGILVMQDFWVSGDCNGRWDDPMKKEDTNARRNYPDDHRLFTESLDDQIKMLRNHPSLAYWCGGNEIRPPEDVLKCLRDTLLPKLDGTRFLFEYSNDDSMSLHSGDGPYTIQPDSFFWSHRSFPFNSEIGSVGIGDYESLQRFIPEKDMVPPVYNETKRQWDIDSVWKYHKYSGYDSAIEAYGRPKDIQEFAKIAQLVNYNQYRALAESFMAHMWDWYTGFIIWKTQNPWTAMVGQMYDVYLDPNACMYGAMEGCKPVHAMYDQVSDSVIVVNNTLDTLRDIRFDEVVYLYGKHPTEQIADSSVPFTILPQSCIRQKFKHGKDLKNGGLLCLTIPYKVWDHKTGEGNFYWFPDEAGSYSYLDKIKNVDIAVVARYTGKRTVELHLKMKGSIFESDIAFFIHVSLVDKKTKKRLVPAFASDNYFCINSVDDKTLQMDYTPEPGIEPMVCIEGWNTGTTYVEISN